MDTIARGRHRLSGQRAEEVDMRTIGRRAPRRVWRHAPVLAAVLGLATAGVALATPPSGASGEVVARAALKDPYGEKMKMLLGLVNSGLFRSTDVAVQRITIAPGGHTGWHTHPGPVVVVVKAGTLTFYSAENNPDCRARVYRAGDAFVDQGLGHVHIARNEGTEPLEFWATYFVPGESGAAFRIDAPSTGNCPF
ncbi:MAG: cupin domain-containing protein [Gaiellaceae bacterium]